jgi:hypothetical protein
MHRHAEAMCARAYVWMCCWVSVCVLAVRFLLTAGESPTMRCPRRHLRFRRLRSDPGAESPTLYALHCLPLGA